MRETRSSCLDSGGVSQPVSADVSSLLVGDTAPRPPQTDVRGPEAPATCPLMSSYESAPEKASSSRFLIYMTLMLQSRVWRGLSAPLAGVYRTDGSWRDADASLTGLKGTALTVHVLSGTTRPAGWGSARRLTVLRAH